MSNLLLINILFNINYNPNNFKVDNSISSLKLQPVKPENLETKKLIANNLAFKMTA